jgi:hypothetical protein
MKVHEQQEKKSDKIRSEVTQANTAKQPEISYLPGKGYEDRLGCRAVNEIHAQQFIEKSDLIGTNHSI